MAQATPAGTFTQDRVGPLAGSPAYQAYRVLQLAFVVAPIVAGADKFFHYLVDWNLYLAPVVDQILGGNGHVFMLAVGVIEIVAGIGVAIKPKIFAYVVSAWLAGIVINLLLAQNFYDIALRDVGLALGALALARLSQQFDTGSAPMPVAR
ncbi:MAG: hypothetical protein WD894_14745 [Pirellulales bacterium]